MAKLISSKAHIAKGQSFQEDDENFRPRSQLPGYSQRAFKYKSATDVRHSQSKRHIPNSHLDQASVAALDARIKAYNRSKDKQSKSSSWKPRQHRVQIQEDPKDRHIADFRSLEQFPRPSRSSRPPKSSSKRQNRFLSVGNNLHANRERFVHDHPVQAPNRTLSVHSIFPDASAGPQQVYELACDPSTIESEQQSLQSPLPQVNTKFTIYRDNLSCLITMRLDHQADPLSVKFTPDPATGKLMITYARQLRMGSIEHLPNEMIGLHPDADREFLSKSKADGDNNQDQDGEEDYIILTQISHNFQFNRFRYHLPSIAISQKGHEFYIKIACHYNNTGNPWH